MHSIPPVLTLAAICLPLSAQAPTVGVTLAAVHAGGEPTSAKRDLEPGFGLQVRFPEGVRGVWVIRVDHTSSTSESIGGPAAVPETELSHTSLGGDFQLMLGSTATLRPYVVGGVGVMRRKDHTFIHRNFLFMDRTETTTRPFVALGAGLGLGRQWSLAVRGQFFTVPDTPSGPSGTRSLVSLEAAYHF